jgi:hypothetical protein
VPLIADMSAFVYFQLPNLSGIRLSTSSSADEDHAATDRDIEPTSVQCASSVVAYISTVADNAPDVPVKNACHDGLALTPKDELSPVDVSALW